MPLIEVLPALAVPANPELVVTVFASSLIAGITARTPVRRHGFDFFNTSVEKWTDYFINRTAVRTINMKYRLCHTFSIVDGMNRKPPVFQDSIT